MMRRVHQAMFVGIWWKSVQPTDLVPLADLRDCLTHDEYYDVVRLLLLPVQIRIDDEVDPVIARELG